jgi:hypothetical protein
MGAFKESPRTYIMRALFASSSSMPVFNFEFSLKTHAKSNKVGHLIANLHSVLVDANAAPGSAAAAKQRLLGVLEQAKRMTPPFMIVPPISRRRAPHSVQPHADPVDEEPWCATCKHPTAASSRWPPNRLPAKAGATSSPSFRARTHWSRGRRAFSPATRTSLTTSRANNYHEYAELS